MKLSEETKNFAEQMGHAAPKEVLDKVGAFIERLNHSDMTDTAIEQGDIAPDFTLPDHEGKHVSLYHLLEHGPVILSFNRGTWCPFCSLEFRALKGKLAEIKNDNAQLISVSPQLPEQAASTLKEFGIDYPVLFDKGNKVAAEYGIVMALDEEMQAIHKNGFGVDLSVQNGDDTFTLPVPAVYVIGQDKHVLYASVNPNWMQREDPEEYLSLLQSKNQ